ncbi:MAG: hypothetical protein CMJ18_01850 [Phycisphaeraceae bacterium]|nr:hypothetical protein [Phycisphaeraceae bacterium]
MRVSGSEIRLIVILVVIVGAFVLVGWFPLHRRTTNLRQQVGALEPKVDGAFAATETIGTLGRHVQRLDDEIGASDKKLPVDAELAAFLSELSNHSKSLQVSDLKMNQGDVINGVDYKVIPVTLGFRGSFQSVFQFITRIESMRRPVRINQLEIGLQGSDEGTEVLNVSVDLDTFSAASEAQS